MRKTLGYLLPLALAVVLMLVCRAHVLTVYILPDDSLAPHFAKGQWVVLNRIDKHDVQRGETIAFRDSTQTEHMGRILKLPGDTLQLADTALYILPSWHRCPRCGSNRCRNYLVGAGQTQTLVHEQSIVGRVRGILPFVRR